MDSVQSVGKIMVGNLGMMACIVFYLIWWYIAFNPNKDFPYAAKAALLVLTVIPGIFGLVQLIKGIRLLSGSAGGVKPLTIVLAGVGVYVVMLLATYFLAHRQVTTELALIIGVSVLELCVENALYSAGVVDRLDMLIYIFFLVVVSLVSLVCYLSYYNLGKMAAFYDGMVPLALFLILILYQTGVLAKSS